MQFIIQHPGPDMFLRSHNGYLRYDWGRLERAKRYTREEAAAITARLPFATMVEVEGREHDRT